MVYPQNILFKVLYLLLVRLMDSVSTSSTLRENGGISSQDSLLITYVPTPRARAASTFDTAALTDKEPSLS